MVSIQSTNILKACISPSAAKPNNKNCYDRKNNKVITTSSQSKLSLHLNTMNMIPLTGIMHSTEFDDNSRS